MKLSRGSWNGRRKGEYQFAIASPSTFLISVALAPTAGDSFLLGFLNCLHMNEEKRYIYVSKQLCGVGVRLKLSTPMILAPKLVV